MAYRFVVQTVGQTFDRPRASTGMALHRSAHAIDVRTSLTSACGAELASIWSSHEACHRAPQVRRVRVTSPARSLAALAINSSRRA